MLFNENGQELFWFLAVFGRTEMRRVPPGFWPPSRCGHEAHAMGVGADPQHVAGLLRVVLRAKSLIISIYCGVAGFFAVFGGMAGDIEGVIVGFANPNGIEAFSPGLRGTSYPG